MLAKRGERRGRDGVHGVGSDQLFDVIGVGIAWVLRRGARPQAALRPRAGLAQLLPARPAEKLLEALVCHLRVGDRCFSVESLEGALLRRIRAQSDLLREDLVHLRVHAAHEEAGHARDATQVAALLVKLFEAGHVGLDHLHVAVDREDQRDVDVVALGDLVEDRRQALLGGGDLHHHVRTPALVVQVLGKCDRASRVGGDRRADLDADEAVLALGPVIDRPEHVRGRLYVRDHQLPQHVVRLFPGPDHLHHRLVVVGRSAHGLLEDGRV